MKAIFRNPEMIFIILVTLWIAIILFMSFQLGFGMMKSPGPGFFPAFTSFFGLFFGISLLIRYATKGAPEGTKPLFEKGQRKRFLAMVVSFCGWLVLMPWLGFIVMTFFATLAFAKIMRLEGWLKPVLLALSGSVFIYLLFDVWFYADLPRGFFGI